MFQIIYRVLSLLKNRKKTVIWLTLANTIFAGLVLVEPIFFKKIIDILIGFGDTSIIDFSPIISILIVWVLVAITTIAIRLSVSILADMMAHDEFNNYVSVFFEKILELSMRFHFNANSWQLVKKITKWVDGIFDVQLTFFRRVLPSFFTIVILIPLVLYFNLKLGLFVIWIWILSAIITFYLATKTFSAQEWVESAYSELSWLYGDTFSNISIVKSFTLDTLKRKELLQLTTKKTSLQYPILKWWGLIVSFSKIINIVVSIGVISFGSYLFIKWEVTIWDIVMFLSFSSLFLAAIEDLTWTLETMFWRLAGIKDYFEIIDTPIEVQDSDMCKKLTQLEWKIEFKKLSFSYDSKREVLQDINMVIEPGQKVAFVWHTWSGKTTMTNMLLRFFEPQKWDVLIDGVNINTVSQKSLRENIGVVFQDNSLFNTTILNNIKLGNKKARRKDIERVAVKSHSSDFIELLSDWLDTIVGERGVKLSGWEKQRLAIARAFLKDAPILILDEATSALDAQTEKYLQNSFDELMKDRTTIIIAHRLSTIQKADVIFVFDKWKIIEQWSYKQLVSKKWAFSKLVESQVKGFID